MFLLLMKAVPSGVAVSTLDNTETTTSGGEGVPVLDKLPPNCRYVEVVSFDLWLWNPWGGIALIVFLLMMKAVASGAAVPTLNNTKTTSSGGEGVPVVDKLLPYCRYVDNRGQCFPCHEMVETTSSGGEGVPVVVKLPQNCRYFDNCGHCFPSEEIAGESFCCDG